MNLIIIQQQIPDTQQQDLQQHARFAIQQIPDGNPLLIVIAASL
jgi:hypothetical protein